MIPFVLHISLGFPDFLCFLGFLCSLCVLSGLGFRIGPSRKPREPKKTRKKRKPRKHRKLRPPTKHIKPRNLTVSGKLRKPRTPRNTNLIFKTNWIPSTQWSAIVTLHCHCGRLYIKVKMNRIPQKAIQSDNDT